MPTKRTRTTAKASSSARAVGVHPEGELDARAQRREALSPVAAKYAAMTVYDPATKSVVDADGVVVTAPTLAELSEYPGTLSLLDRPYECEDADEATCARLAKLAGITVAALMARRHDWTTTPAECPATVRVNRQRCWRCPRWRETDETLF